MPHVLRLMGSVVAAATLVACVPSQRENSTNDAGASHPAVRPVQKRQVQPALNLPFREQPNRKRARPLKPPEARSGVRHPSAAAPASASASAAAPAGSAAPPATSAGAPKTGAQAQEKDPLLEKPFQDFFNRQDVGPDWNVTSPVWHIQRGRLCGQGAKNHGVWLKRRLPVNARIEFDATTGSPDGDIKAEFWGDGHSTATGVSYTNATSYLTIFGGWKNHYHVLARINEHAPDRPQVIIQPGSTELKKQPVRPNVIYHFKVVRENGRTLHWYVNDIEILNYTDPKPLEGPGHDHFGFNNWAVPLCFDDLEITPLPNH